MESRLVFAAGLVLDLCPALVATPAAAQIVAMPPLLENRIPAPLPPPGVYVPPQLNTHGDRIIGCQHQGRADGLRGRRLQAYVRECANAN